MKQPLVDLAAKLEITENTLVNDALELYLNFYKVYGEKPNPQLVMQKLTELKELLKGE